MASTGSVKRLANSCVTVTRATKPEIWTATSVCLSGQAPSGLPPGPIASSAPDPGMGFSSARAGPPPRRNAVRTAMAIVRGRAVFSIDEEVSAPREIGSRCVTGAGACVFAPAVASGRIGAAVDKDWLAVLGRLRAGDGGVGGAGRARPGALERGARPSPRGAARAGRRLPPGQDLRAGVRRDGAAARHHEAPPARRAPGAAAALRGGWAMRARARDLSMGVR